MKFKEYSGICSVFPRKDLARHITFAANELEKRQMYSPVVTNAVTVTMYLEGLWSDAGRPYYDVYPAIEKAFLKLDLNKINISMMSFPVLPMLIRTADKAFIFHMNKDRDKLAVALESASKETCVAKLSIGKDTTVGMALMDDQVRDESLAECLKLACSCGLLDAEFLEAEVLSKDNTPSVVGDPAKLQAAIDRARRRGKLGWSIGKSNVVAPHIRGSHMALMWTGPGRHIPKYVLRRECVVHRDKVLTKPTGHLDQQD